VVTITECRPFQESSVQTGCELLVEACAVDGGGVVPLDVEWVSEPVAAEGWITFFVRLIGTVDGELTTPGRHRVHQAGRSFDLNLTRVGRRGNLVSYAAVVIEPA